MLTKLQVLLQPTTQRVPAALSGLATFVETLRLLVEAQQAVATAEASSAQPLSGRAQPDVKAEELDTGGVTPMEEGGAGGDPPVQEKAASKAVTGTSDHHGMKTSVRARSRCTYFASFFGLLDNTSCAGQSFFRKYLFEMLLPETFTARLS